MQQRTLGKTGMAVSVIGFGSGPVGILAVDQQQATTLLNALLDAGINLIDTAAAYAGAEQAIGNAVRERRDQYVLVSKCGAPGSAPDDPSWRADALTASIDRSLVRLQTDRIDVMLLHSPTLETLQQGEALGALIAARDAGKIRWVGYSGDNQAAAYACALSDVAVVEMSVNLCDQQNIDTVLPLAEQNGVGVIAKRPLANAAWKQLGQQPGFYQEYAETYTRRLAAMNVSLADLDLEEGSADWPEVALRFTLAHPSLHTAIVGSTNLEHIRSNIAAAQKGPLREAAYERLRQAFREAEAQAGETWAGET